MVSSCKPDWGREEMKKEPTNTWAEKLESGGLSDPEGVAPTTQEQRTSVYFLCTAQEGRGRESLKEVSVAEHSQVPLIQKEEAVVGSFGEREKKKGQSFINPCACHQCLYSAQRKALPLF